MKARSTKRQLNRPLTVAQREAISEWANKEYENIKDKHEAQIAARFSLTFSIALMQTLEEYMEFGEKRRNAFQVEMAKRMNELCDYLLDNTYTEGNSNQIQYDVDFNHSRLEQFAKYYGLKYDPEELWGEILPSKE